MTPIPTLHLRFVERQEFDPENSTHEYAAHRTVRVLQQFWEDPSGGDAVGDMFKMVIGRWRDIPLERNE